MRAPMLPQSPLVLVVRTNDIHTMALTPESASPRGKLRVPVLRSASTATERVRDADAIQRSTGLAGPSAQLAAARRLATRPLVAPSPRRLAILS